MKSITTLILIVFIIVFNACSKQSKKQDKMLPVVDTVKQPDKKNINRIGVSLKSNTRKEIAEWKEYQSVDAILTNYYAISNAEALSNAQELSRLVTNLRDSISDEKLMMPSVKARINILHNECVRLNDMASIPAITPEEVTESITRILSAYSGLNAKLNSLYAVSELENELELDPDFLKILNDSTVNSPWDMKNSKDIQNIKTNKKTLENRKKPLQNNLRGKEKIISPKK